MSVPTGSAVEAQAQSSGAAPTPTPGPCPGGDVPREGSRDIHQRGKIISVPYDWCNSTDSPIPYRIWAWQSSASKLANSVRQTDCRSHVLGSIVNECYGDEPGTGGGIQSGTNLAECTPLSYSPTVRAEGKPMVRYLDKWHMNHGNTWGCLNNSEDTNKYAQPVPKKIDPRMMLALNDTSGTATDARMPTPAPQEMPQTAPQSPQTSPQEVPQQDPADARGSIAKKVLWRGAVAAGAAASALAGLFLVISTTSTAKNDTVRVTRSRPGQTCDDDVLDKLEKEKDILQANVFTNQAFKSANAKKLAKVSCEDLLKRIEGMKKVRDARQKIQDECYKGNPDPTHQQSIDELNNGIAKNQDRAKIACGPQYVP